MTTGTRAPSTIVTINLSGQTDFNIPFEYLARKFVVVTLLGIDRKVLTLNTDYRFVSKTVISLANPTPAGYSQLELRRETSATERLVDFHDGSILRAYDLNLSQIQTLHVAEEARSNVSDAIGIDDNGNLDARNRNIVNLTGGTADTDAVNYGQLRQFDNSTLVNATRAEQARFAAEAAAAEAATVSGRIGLRALASFTNFSWEDCGPAMKTSQALLGYVYMPQVAGRTYTVVNFVEDTALRHLHLIVDSNTNISFDWDYYEGLKTFTWEGECNLHFRGLFKQRGGEVVTHPSAISLPSEFSACVPVAVSECTTKQLTSGLDVVTSSNPVFTLGDPVFGVGVSPASTGGYMGVFTPLAVGDTVTAKVSTPDVSARTGILVIGDTGYALFDGFIDGAQWDYRVRIGSGPLVSGTPIQLPEGLLSFAAGRATVGITLRSSSVYELRLNGTGVTFPFDSEIGTIREIGFVSSGAGNTEVEGLLRYRTVSALGGVVGQTPRDILIHGDSTAEGFVSAFDMYLPQLLDGANGTRTVNIQNKAIAGTTMRQQLDALKAEGFGSATVVIMVAGTNDAQGGVVPAFQFAAMAKEFVEFCLAYNRIPVWVEPWMWYPKEAINGGGQASGNYQNAASIREAGKRVVSSYGDQALCISTTHNLPNPLPSYVLNNKVDPLLRDDIHQSKLGYQLYAKLISVALLRHLTKTGDDTVSIPQTWASGGMTLSAAASVKRGRLNLLGSVTGFSNDSVVLKLPSVYRPSVDVYSPLTFTSDNVTFSTVLASVRTSGDVTLSGLTASAGVVRGTIML